MSEILIYKKFLQITQLNELFVHQWNTFLVTLLTTKNKSWECRNSSVYKNTNANKNRWSIKTLALESDMSYMCNWHLLTGTGRSGLFLFAGLVIPLINECMITNNLLTLFIPLTHTPNGKSTFPPFLC